PPTAVRRADERAGYRRVVFVRFMETRELDLVAGTGSIALPGRAHARARTLLADLNALHALAHVAAQAAAFDEFAVVDLVQASRDLVLSGVFDRTGQAVRERLSSVVDQRLEVGRPRQVARVRAEDAIATALHTGLAYALSVTPRASCPPGSSAQRRAGSGRGFPKRCPIRARSFAPKTRTNARSRSGSARSRADLLPVVVRTR